MTQVADDALQAGREAAARGAFGEAFDLLIPAERSLGPDDLELIAESAFWTGRLDQAMAFRERAHAGHLANGDNERAALLALLASRDYFGKGDLSVSNGWFAKAERLLADEPESPVRGYLAIAKAMNAMGMGDLDALLNHSREAFALARRHGDRNLEATALVTEGRGLVLQGETLKGLALLDEATAAAVSGDLDPYSTGFIYCVTITSCHGVGDLRRAQEWTSAANRWCERQDLRGFPGACRVHHATITRLQGDWPKAEEQALLACEELQGFDVWTTSAGFYEIAEIRRRRGDFAAAEEAYRRTKEWGRDPQPSLAQLRLAQGKIEAASAAIKRSLTGMAEPLGRLRRLPAQVEIALAAGELRTARDAVEELEQITDRFRLGDERSPAFEAAVCLAWGQLRLAENDVDDAIGRLERAVGAPYEVAEAQMLLGLALRRRGDEDGAREELIAARTAFERLGAVLDVQRATELLGEQDVRRTFMFTDIVDSSRYVELLGPEKWQKLLTWHDETLREAIEQAGGEVIKHTGDGYFAAFGTAGSALEAAVSVQRALDAHVPLAPDVRIGVHTGGAFHHGDEDYAGQGVHMAARIGALATAGEILVSHESVDGGRYPLSEPRAEELKGFDEPVELVTVSWR